MAKTETDREQRDRKRNAVTREMNRLRATDEPEDTEPEETDLVDGVRAEQQRERDVQDDDPPY